MARSTTTSAYCASIDVQALMIRLASRFTLASGVAAMDHGGKNLGGDRTPPIRHRRPHGARV